VDGPAARSACNCMAIEIIQGGLDDLRVVPFFPVSGRPGIFQSLVPTLFLCSGSRITEDLPELNLKCSDGLYCGQRHISGLPLVGAMELKGIPLAEQLQYFTV
jgi:hypothetical protein